MKRHYLIFFAIADAPACSDPSPGFEFDGSSFAAPGQHLDVFVARARP